MHVESSENLKKKEKESEGRVEGRKGGRKEKRKEGREEGRKEGEKEISGPTHSGVVRISEGVQTASVFLQAILMCSQAKAAWPHCCTWSPHWNQQQRYIQAKGHLGAQVSENI